MEHFSAYQVNFAVHESKTNALIDAKLIIFPLHVFRTHLTSISVLMIDDEKSRFETQSLELQIQEAKKRAIEFSHSLRVSLLSNVWFKFVYLRNTGKRRI